MTETRGTLASLTTIFNLVGFFLLGMSLVVPPPLQAGIGSEISEAILVDTLVPEVDLDEVPDNLLLFVGEYYTFSWTSFDQNPGTQPTDFLAQIVVADTVYEDISWSRSPQGAKWNWLIPEIIAGDCHLKVIARDIMGNTTTTRTQDFTVFTSGVADDTPELQPTLGQPFPNPFNPSCQVEFSLPEATTVQMHVFDARGRRVRELWNGLAPAGVNRVQWGGTDQHGRAQAGGVYFFVLQTPGAARQITRAILIP